MSEDPPPHDDGPWPAPGSPRGSPHAGRSGSRTAQPDGLSAEDKVWGSAAHWSALVASCVAMAFLGPLVVLLVKGGSSPWVRHQATESLNFQLSMLIYGAVGGLLAAFVVLATFGIGVFVVLPVVVAFGAFWLVFTVIGAVSAAGGGAWRYPLTIRMVR